MAEKKAAERYEKRLAKETADKNPSQTEMSWPAQQPSQVPSSWENPVCSQPSQQSQLQPAMSLRTAPAKLVM